MIKCIFGIFFYYRSLNVGFKYSFSCCFFREVSYLSMFLIFYIVNNLILLYIISLNLDSGAPFPIAPGSPNVT